jgi:hypothetical protein
MKSNPFYALSASAMLLGCFLLGQALELEAGRLRGLLILIAVLQVYELILTGLGTHLVRSGRAPRDGVVGLALASVFLMNATGLSAECVTSDRGVGLLVTAAIAALGALKLWWVRREAPDLLPGRAAIALGVHAALVLALPLAAAQLAAARALGPMALYGFWWLTAALPLARPPLIGAGGVPAALSPRARAIWTWMPTLLVSLHLWSVGYIHSIDFRLPFLAPLLLGMALAARPDQQPRKLALPAVALLFSLLTDPALVAPLPLTGAPASSLRLSLVAVGLVWLYLGWRDREPWLAALPVSGAALYLLGPHAARAGRALARVLADGLPRDRFGWGALTVLAAFVLLAAGARRSLYGEPRWPEGRRRVHQGAEGGHAIPIGR